MEGEWLAVFGRHREGRVFGRMFEVIPGYTLRVKTAISIPDQIFRRAEEQAALLGVSRSEFFATAVRRYLDVLEAESLTSRINIAMDIVWPAGVTIESLDHDRDRAASGDSPW